MEGGRGVVLLLYNSEGLLGDGCHEDEAALWEFLFRNNVWMHAVLRDSEQLLLGEVAAESSTAKRCRSGVCARCKAV